MTDGLFESVVTFPNPAANDRYHGLIGLDAMKERLEREAETLLRPDLLEKWSREHHGSRLAALDLMERRPPLFVFAGDVGTGKTELALTFGDRLARQARIPVHLYVLSLRARGAGAVGEMTRLISDAFAQLGAASKESHAVSRARSAKILLIDEADALAQSREMAQMHHEDRAGVNALIRGIDGIANAKLPCLILMCTNRVGAIDPAVLRRAAAVFEFKRPSPELRLSLLKAQLSDAGLANAALSTLSDKLGESKTRSYGYTFSDITQRVIPAIVLAAYPDKKITLELAQNVIDKMEPTPPFRSSGV